MTRPIKYENGEFKIFDNTDILELKTELGLEVGVNVQAFDPTLESLSGLAGQGYIYLNIDGTVETRAGSGSGGSVEWADILNKPISFTPSAHTHVIADVTGLQTELDSKLSSFTETDPVFTASPAFNITNTNITNWNSAFSWGNHSLAGYLTSFTELDPIFTASPAFNITNTNITNWDSAFSWGNHSLAGYQDELVSGTNIKTINGTSVLGSGNITIAASGSVEWDDVLNKPISFTPSAHTHVIADVTGLQTALDSKLSSFTETDPVFTASPAFNITNTNITNWNSAFSWGNHSLAGYLTSSTAATTYQPLDADLTSIAGLSGTTGILRKTALNTFTLDTSVYLTSFTETDPIFAASPAFNITNTNITNWNSAFSWGNHSLVGYLTSFTETDPVFIASAAFNITNTNITNWNSAFSWGNHSTAGYQSQLISGTNIKTINGTSVLGSGNITISGGSGGGIVWSVKTTNFSAVVNEAYVVTSAVTATLPSTVAVGDQIIIAAKNNITVELNGLTISSVSSSLTLTSGETVYLVATSTTNMEIV